MVEYWVFNPEFLPIVRIGDNILVMPTGVFFRVSFVEPIQPIVRDFGPLSQTTDPSNPAAIVDRDFDELKMNPGELGQFRLAPLDDVRVYVSHPRALRKYTTKSVVTYIGVEAWHLHPRLSFTEIFVFEDDVPTITIVNPSFYPQPSSRVMAYGYRFVLEQLSDSEVKQLLSGQGRYTVIPVSGFTRATEWSLKRFIQSQQKG